ncbi:MAG: DUF3536 domain-containing protein [Deltaproteobacteria bacterium]|nr:DUF3536 domain-containing protein [Deltaproteobacteria bacterium]
MSTALVIHGHFYQPPRENPWTGNVDREPSAYPEHDWNERIYHECYRPNAFARVVGDFGYIEKIVNNYSFLSFNFGPTLLSWLQTRHPATYLRVLEADRQSAQRWGHGSAIAQGYNHTILPLCNERDRITQVRWGIADFVHRFGRKPESLWLPETACNDETLGTLIDEGMVYVILSPHQAEQVRPLADDGKSSQHSWRYVGDGSVDPSMPYRYFHKDGSGRSIALFFYDGPKSRSIAFEGALASSQALITRLSMGANAETKLVHIATDGESYGHHTKFAELALAHALVHQAQAQGFEVTNYGAFIEKNPPTMEAMIKPGPNGEGTAWSCAHGVGRWYRDCGCNTGAQQGWNQAWRQPLRQALDILRDAAAERFDTEGRELFTDPWQARNDYIELVLDRSRSREAWLQQHQARVLTTRERERALSLLEMQRNAMLMYTSCGWFFADLSGIETVQIMKYAERVFDHMDALGIESPREAFMKKLAEAKSNVPEHGNGAEIYRKWVEPLRVSMHRVAAHLGIMSLVEDEPGEGSVAGYRYCRTSFQKNRHGRLTLATGRLELEDIPSGRLTDWGFAAVHMGGVDFYCVCQPYPGGQAFTNNTQKIWSAYRTATLPRLLRLIQESMGPEDFGLETILEEGQHRISELVYGNIVTRFSQQYVAMFESNQRILDMLQEAGLELPEELVRAAEFTLGKRFEEEIRRAHGSFDPQAYERALQIAAEVKRRGYKIDTSKAGRLFGRTLADVVSGALADPSQERFAAATSLAQLSDALGLKPNLGRAQELVYLGFRSHPDWMPALSTLARAVGVKQPS